MVPWATRLTRHWATWVTVVTIQGGCDRGSFQHDRGREPVLLASSLDLHPACSPEDDTPLACRREIELRPLFVLRFDRPLSPSSVARANYRLSSGEEPSVTYNRVRVDPVERTVVIAIDHPLAPDTRYELHVEPAERLEDRLSSFDGVAMTSRYSLVFWTKRRAEPGDQDASDFEPVPADPCAAERILRGCGAQAGCHGSDLHQGHAMGLVLDSAAGIAAAFGRMSALAQTADDPGGAGGWSSSSFPYGLPVMATGSSAGSFLMYKLLQHASLDAWDESETRRPPHPTLAVPDPVVGPPLEHLAKIVAATMPGRAMPPPDQGYPPLTVTELRTLRRWIDDGGRGCSENR